MTSERGVPTKRARVKFRDARDLAAKRAAFVAVICQWIRQLPKA